MRSYLIEFFSLFQYKAEDANFLLKTYDAIYADPEARNLWEEAIGLYDSNIDCDYKKILQIADFVAEKLYFHVFTTELLIFICLTKKAKEYYAEQGLSEEIYRNTMSDLRYKLEECKLVKGVVGLFSGIWSAGFFKLSRFALGRLQFELKQFGYSYRKNGKELTPESTVINVHIPRSLVPLSEEQCSRSYYCARDFFAKEIGTDCAFVCSSWLLYPEHKDFLPKHTNTYRFISQFDVIESGVYRDGEELWRLFDSDERNPNRLPADTSMRKAYVEHLKKGGKTGWGYGVFFLD